MIRCAPLELHSTVLCYTNNIRFIGLPHMLFDIYDHFFDGMIYSQRRDYLLGICHGGH